MPREYTLHTTAEHAPRIQDALELTSRVRQALGRAIVQGLFPGNGEVQVMSAGTGITHSEYNKNTDKPVKFLQICYNLLKLMVLSLDTVNADNTTEKQILTAIEK